MARFSFHLSRLVALFTIGVVETWAGEFEYRLTRYLLSNYESDVRPSSDGAEGPLIVNFDVSIHQIIDVDEKNQILTTNCWLTQTWIDAHLMWNASDFGNVHTIRLPYHRVWRPDIILYNNADSNYNNAIINTNVMVSSDGMVTLLSHGIFRSSCRISVEYFPFDVQECHMKFASWSYDGTAVDLSMIHEVGDMSNYVPNGEFGLEHFNPARHVVHYSCCPEPYIDITYSMRLRRRPMFYVFNLILPCILINGIALLVFYVPSESGEKVTLGISALLSMTVFLMTIRESLPPTEQTPLISLYYGVSICLVSFASALAVLTLNIHHRGMRGRPVPQTLRLVVLGLMARVLWINFESQQLRRVANDENVGNGCLDDVNASSLCVSGYLGRAEMRHCDKDRKETMAREWKHVSIVLDRALLLCFFLLMSVSSIIILTSSPHLFNNNGS